MKKTLATAIAALLASGGAYAEQNLPDLGKTGVVTAGSAFNPAISVILDASYYHDNSRSKGERGGNDRTYTYAIEHIRGFTDPHVHDHDHDHGELEPGFNLHHAEVLFSASVDNYFDAVLALGVSEHGIEIEEAYGVTRNLPAGLQIKAGKFFSGIGYHNSQHSHDWSFADMALPYQLMFGDHGLNEKGIQLTWTPATENYMVFGVEALQGENERIANQSVPSAAGSDPGSRYNYTVGGQSKANGPRMYTAFAKFAPDLGHNHALQIGLFGGHSRMNKDPHGSRVYEGKPSFIGTDWVYKYDGGGHMGHRSLTLQAEYIRREFDRTVVATNANNAGLLGDTRKDTQDAMYIQGVYGIAPRWQAGLRYELAGMTNRRVDTAAVTGNTTTRDWDSSNRITANVTWHPTEFSKLRLQAARSSFLIPNRTGATPADVKESYNQIYLQYQLSLGVHGAHRF